MRLVNCFLPASRVNTRWSDLGKGIDDRRDLRHSVICPGAIANSPLPENQVQGSPEEENGGAGQQHKPAAGMVRAQGLGTGGGSWGMYDG